MKAKKIETFYDKYSNTVVYEYRGCQYEVEYANSIHYCVSPAWVQHRDAQEKIDKALDNPNPKRECEQTFDEQLDEVWAMLEW